MGVGRDDLGRSYLSRRGGSFGMLERERIGGDLMFGAFPIIRRADKLVSFE